MRNRRYRLLCILGIAAATLAHLFSSADAAEATTFDEPWRSGIGLAFDNDVLAGSSGDRDYTGGAAVTFGGRRAKDWPFSVGPVLRWLDKGTRFATLYNVGAYGEQRHAMQIGLIVFTPDDIEMVLPIQDGQALCQPALHEPTPASLYIQSDEQCTDLRSLSAC